MLFFTSSFRANPLLASSLIGLGIFVLVAAGFAAFGPGSFSARALGFRFDAAWLLLVPAVLAFDLTPQEIRRILGGFVLSGAVALGVALASHFFLPIDWRVALGFRDIGGQFAPDRLAAAYFTQADGTPQMVGTFSSPNHLAAWILLWTGATYHVSRGAKHHAFVTVLVFIVAGLCVLATGSSAGMLGFAVASAALSARYQMSKVKLQISRWFPLGIFALGASSFVLAWAAALRLLPDEIHFSRAREALTSIAAHPLGSGLGVTGPAMHELAGAGHAPVAENWYLQLAAELGIGPAILFFLAFAGLGVGLLASRSSFGKSVGAGILGVAVMSTFLHPLEAQPVAMTLVVLGGLAARAALGPSTR